MFAIRLLAAQVQMQMQMQASMDFFVAIDVAVDLLMADMEQTGDLLQVQAATDTRPRQHRR